MLNTQNFRNCYYTKFVNCYLYGNLQRSTLSGRSKDYSEYFNALGISEESDQSSAREAFINLAKKYHPDSGHKQADSATFQKIEYAYRKLLEKFSHERHNRDSEGEYGLYYNQKNRDASEETGTKEIYDIKHTAPQHRQYLSYEGIGIGTPSQREKQFTKYRAMRAAENIIDYKIQQLSQDTDETALAIKDNKAAKNIRTRYGIDRLVEDKIQESIAKGDFDNLPNAGKPLKFQNHNPFVDIVTHKLNQILIENGYAPEWVMLEKEIREDRAHIKKKLETSRSKLGTWPLSESEQVIWRKILSNLTPDVDSLNKKIDKYNLVVPILTKQTVHFPLKRVEEKILKEGIANDQKRITRQEFKTENTRGATLSTSFPAEEGGLRTLLGMFKGR